MKARFVVVVAAFLSLFPAVASAQSVGGGHSTIGLGVNAVVDGGSGFGVALPVFVGSRFRIEPGVSFQYQEAVAEGITGATQTVTNVQVRLRAGIHSMFAFAESARAFYGLDVAYFGGEETETLEVRVNGVTNTTESSTSASGFTFALVLGGEFEAAGGLFLGVRAGPTFGIVEPDLGDDTISDASAFLFGGYGRVDATYYF